MKVDVVLGWCMEWADRSGSIPHAVEGRGMQIMGDKSHMGAGFMDCTPDTKGMESGISWFLETKWCPCGR